MSGIALTFGSNASSLCREMLAQTPGKQKQQIDATKTLSVGRAYHGKAIYERGPQDYDGVVVAMDGFVLGSDMPLHNPEDVFYEKYLSNSLDTVSELNGSFSALIIDVARDRVVILTDRLGTRSLFMNNDLSNLAVATSLKALLCDGRISRRLSTVTIFDLLAYQRAVNDHAPYADVTNVTASAVWTITQQKIIKHKSWRLAWQPRAISTEEASVSLSGALTRAARRLCAGQPKVGVLLSGGLDSRLTLAAINKAGLASDAITLAAEQNAEVQAARAVAQASNAPFNYISVPPLKLSASLDDAAQAVHGVLSAPMNFYGSLPQFADNYSLLLSGHGVDYTLRGIHLPCIRVQLRRSKMRLPILEKLSSITPEYLANNWRAGLPAETIKRILQPDAVKRFEAARIAAMEQVLGEVNLATPYDAWDAFTLHHQCLHYTFNDFISMRDYVENHTLAFDKEVFDLYLSLPPKMRAGSDIPRKALLQLAPKLAALPDANTGTSASRGSWMQLLHHALQAWGRRLPGRQNPIAGATHGSWANFALLMRTDPILLSRLEALPKSAALMDTGLFDEKRLRDLISDHLANRADYRKLLRILLTIDSWYTQYPYKGVAI